jgi:hypothetical protein
LGLTLASAAKANARLQESSDNDFQKRRDDFGCD